MSLAGRPCASKSAIALRYGGRWRITLIPGTQIIQPRFAAGIEHEAVFRQPPQHAFNTLQLRHCAGNCLNLSSPNTCCCGESIILQLFADGYPQPILRINIVIAGVNVAVVLNNHRAPTGWLMMANRTRRTDKIGTPIRYSSRKSCRRRV